MSDTQIIDFFLEKARKKLNDEYISSHIQQKEGVSNTLLEYSRIVDEHIARVIREPGYHTKPVICGIVSEVRKCKNF